MPRQVVPLTDTKIRGIQSSEKPITVFEGGGLFLIVQPKGGKWWRLKYQHLGKTKALSFGTYPEVSLKEARDRRERARKLLANGTDPSEDRKEQKRAAQATATTFKDVFSEWLDIEATKLSTRTVNKIQASMDIHALPKIGEMPISEIKVNDLLVMLRTVEAKDAQLRSNAG